jgi:hypothetical protein
MTRLMAVGVFVSAGLTPLWAGRLPGSWPVPPQPKQVSAGTTAASGPLRSFTAKGSVTFAVGPNSVRRGTFELWCELPDKFARREQITYAKSRGLGAGEPVDVVRTTLGFAKSAVIYDGPWPGATTFRTQGTGTPIPRARPICCRSCPGRAATGST